MNMSPEDEVIDLRKVDIIDYHFNSLPLRVYACITKVVSVNCSRLSMVIISLSLLQPSPESVAIPVPSESEEEEFLNLPEVEIPNHCSEQPNVIEPN